MGVDFGLLGGVSILLKAFLMRGQGSKSGNASDFRTGRKY